ncbi:MAG TPA: catalase family peroxidase [Methyloceanibacter sp.]|nr:catalase family peroxidase [Methyloceanibacter sp.]
MPSTRFRIVSRPARALSLLFGIALLAAASGANAEPATKVPAGPADLVNALNDVFGKYPGQRSAHTKGICLTGTFTPAADAPKLSKAPHFGKTVPITARFSLGGGNLKAPDNGQDNVRGFAIRFDLGDGASTDLVTISAPVFFVQTPEQFVELLKTVGSGDQDKIKAFFESHPASTRQKAWLTSHGFTFTNAAGGATLAKYKLIPEAGELGLTREEAEAKGPDFYAEELKERLANGPVVFDLTAIIGKEGDQTTDPTLRWDGEDDRPTAPLGKISVEAIAPDATCNAFSFLPGNVVDGIAGPANDPIFQIRSPAYIVSFTRRLTP